MATQPQLETAGADSHVAPRASLTDSGKIAILRKKLVRREVPDHSQALRRSFQPAFLALNVWVGATFYFWVRQFETGALDRTMMRPAGVEGWLPIAGLMNLKYWLNTGRLPATHPAALFLLVTFLAIAFLFRKAFCSWLCPVGTLSEYLWRAGRRTFRRNLRLPRWLDIPLRGMKYVLLGFFVLAITSMSAGAIESLMRSPYGAIADVRMLNFFRFLGETAAIVLAVPVVASVLIQNFWCRYLCPYGALLGLTSFLSPLRIRRAASACINCAKCAKACPSSLPVDRLVSIKSAECTGCMECVAVCPADGALQLALPEWTKAPCGGRISPWALAAGIAVLFFGIVGFAKTAGYWNSDIPNYVYRQLVPRANKVEHPL